MRRKNKELKEMNMVEDILWKDYRRALKQINRILRHIFILMGFCTLVFILVDINPTELFFLSFTGVIMLATMGAALFLIKISYHVSCIHRILEKKLLRVKVLDKVKLTSELEGY